MIGSINLKQGESLALVPNGKSFEPLPEPIKPSYDIQKIIIKEKLAKINLKSFGFVSLEQMD